MRDAAAGAAAVGRAERVELLVLHVTEEALRRRREVPAVGRGGLAQLARALVRAVGDDDVRGVVVGAAGVEPPLLPGPALLRRLVHAEVAGLVERLVGVVEDPPRVRVSAVVAFVLEGGVEEGGDPVRQHVAPVAEMRGALTEQVVVELLIGDHFFLIWHHVADVKAHCRCIDGVVVVSIKPHTPWRYIVGPDLIVTLEPGLAAFKPRVSVEAARDLSV